MHVWLLHVGEELPVDENPRLFRYGHLANAIAEKGHSVLRWAPTFQHFRKYQRFESDQRIQINELHEIQFVYAPGYSKNISLARWYSYHKLGERLKHLLRAERQPDVIVTGLPSLEWCEIATTYGQQHNIPVVLDVRDLWPDIYLQILPRGLRSIGEKLLTPLQQKIKRVCQSVTSIYGVSENYLEWGLLKSARPRQANDHVFPLGYQESQGSEDTRKRILTDLEKRHVDSNKIICLFAGLIEKLYDVESVVAAAKILENRAPGKFQFIICGKGSKLPKVKKMACNVDSVISLGWVDPKTISAIMSISKIGLATYAEGAPQSLPNKPFEYMAGKLAIITSLSGELPTLLKEHNCGFSYKAGNASDLAAVISQITSNPEKLERVRNNSYRLFIEQYQVKKIYSAFCDSLSKLANKK